MRLHQLTNHDAHRAAAALLLLHPSIPMLFMGEEFASQHPFYFFADFGDEPLRTAVEEGRRREYPQHDWSATVSPLSEEAFRRSYIGDATDGNAQTLNWYQSLIRLRKRWSRDGLLAARNFEAHWDDAKRLARLKYRFKDQVANVLIRLHSPDETSEPLNLRLPEELELATHCRAVAREPGVFQLAAFAVAAFRTSIHSDSRQAQ